MRRLILAAGVGLLISVVPLVAVADSGHLQARLRPAGGGTVRGTAVWATASEQYPIVLSIKGALPDSTVLLKVCGTTVNGETGAVFDQCWPTFIDRDRHLMGILVDEDGRARAELHAKLGVAGTFLLTAERVELYVVDGVTAAAVGELKGRTNVVGGSLTASVVQSRPVARAALRRIP